MNYFICFKDILVKFTEIVINKIKVKYNFYYANLMHLLAYFVLFFVLFGSFFRFVWYALKNKCVNLHLHRCLKYFDVFINPNDA